MKLVISSQVPEEILAPLKEVYSLDYHNSQVPLTKDELKEKIKDADALLCPLSDKIDGDLMEAGKNLKMIANYGAGFDNIDLEAAKERNIVVTNAPAPSSAVSTAELTFALILASARKLVAGDKMLRRGEFHGWRPTFYLGSQLQGKTLGIIGLGNIGKNVAKRALAFGMEVIYYSRTRKEDMEKEGLVYKDFESVLKEADILTLHTAYVPDLHHMISKKEFALMKDSALLINASRGPVVDEAALVDALKEGQIAGAGLDVYEREPAVEEGLLELDQVILSPHLGNATFAARLEMAENAKDNLLQFARGEKPQNQVN